MEEKEIADLLIKTRKIAQIMRIHKIVVPVLKTMNTITSIVNPGDANASAAVIEMAKMADKVVLELEEFCKKYWDETRSPEPMFTPKENL